MSLHSSASSSTIKLLSAVEIDQAVAAAQNLIEHNLQPAAGGLAIWDADTENAINYALFGTAKRQFKKIFDDYLSIADGRLRHIQEVDYSQLTAPVKDQFKPMLACPLIHQDALAGYLLLSLPHAEAAARISKFLKAYPIAFALARAWEFSRLKSENLRLRSQYGELELSIRTTEHDARELINDVVTRDALHTRQLERDRLVYGISNVVRSSVQINEVLHNAVTEIGKSFGVTHCLLLSNVSFGEITGHRTNNIHLVNQQIVYEWHYSGEPSLIDFFKTTVGKKLTGAATTSMVVQDLSDLNFEPREQELLSRHGLNCGLLIPLVLRNTVLGAIMLKDHNPGRQWSIDDTALLGSLADQLSVAIENAQLHKEKELQAVTDALTGITNRRRFNEVFEQEFERATRYQTPLSLVLADLDYLKHVNDNYGHQAGDEAIKTVAQVLQESSRSIDLAARYGGEEFCLLLPNTGLEEARQIAERLQHLISVQKIAGAGHITASIGVATFPQHGHNPDELFRSADQALYQAKQSGRNRVRAA